MDHYAVVNMSILATIVDAVGGVDIDVPYDVEKFSAGYQHMTGEQAVAFARIRSVDNDWFRGVRGYFCAIALYRGHGRRFFRCSGPPVVSDGNSISRSLQYCGYGGSGQRYHSWPAGGHADSFRDDRQL